MSARRIIPLAAGLIALAMPAWAQTPATNDQLSPGMDSGAMPPVMDQGIFAHAIFNQNEGRFNGANTQYRWEGQGWIGTDYDKLWIKSEGTVRKGRVDDGQQQFLYSRAVTTYFDLQGGLRSDIDSRPTRNWAAFGIQGLAPILSIWKLPTLSAARAISPASSRLPTTFYLRSGLSCSRKSS